MNKTKDELLELYGGNFKQLKDKGYTNNHIFIPKHIFEKAIDEHTKEEAIGFRWWMQYHEQRPLESQFIFGKTTEQLYEIYQQCKNKNEQ